MTHTDECDSNERDEDGRPYCCNCGADDAPETACFDHGKPNCPECFLYFRAEDRIRALEVKLASVKAERQDAIYDLHKAEAERDKAAADLRTARQDAVRFRMATDKAEAERDALREWQKRAREVIKWAVVGGAHWTGPSDPYEFGKRLIIESQSE